MIAALVAFAVRLGVPGRFAGAVVWFAIFVALVAGLATLKTIYARQLIAGHDASVSATVAPKVRAADGVAADTRRTDDARTAAETQTLEKVIYHAPSAPISDARRSYYDCLRVQQNARAARNPAPACD